jgi:endonuclease/exonuclease/phosphatase (EEP) superfamily protein YafD
VLAGASWTTALWLYGSTFVPSVAPAGATGELRLRVLTFNVMWSNSTPEAVVDVIGEEGADVVLIQELSVPVARAIDAGLSGLYPYRRLRPDAKDSGAGILSRLPLVAETPIPALPETATWQHATLDIDGRRLELVNLHLTAPTLRWRDPNRWPYLPLVGGVPLARRQEAAIAASYLRQLVDRGAAVVAAGDLNLSDQTAEHAELIAAGLVDAHRIAGWGLGLTFPAYPITRLLRLSFPPVPLARFDYVLCSPGVRPVRTVVGTRSAGSDHFPVLAELALKG